MSEGRYIIERQDGLTECQHPLCEQLHQRFIERDLHWCAYVAWHVWDNEKDDYAVHHQFDTKREAKDWLDGFMSTGEH